MPDLKKELDYFIAHQKELVEKYAGKFLVIKNLQVVSVHDKEIEAYEEAQKEHELGTFIIQQALPGEESYTQTFHSLVSL